MTAGGEPSKHMQSLFLVALRAAQKHCYGGGKGNDKDAVACWFRENWHAWYRDRWVEHLSGKKRWQDFPDDDFDVFSSDSLTADHALAARIVSNLQKHRDNISENLGIVFAVDKEGQDMGEVLKILKRLRINDNRPDCDEARVKVFYLALEEADKYKWIQSQKAGRDLGEDCIAEWFDRHWPTFAVEHGLPPDARPEA